MSTEPPPLPSLSPADLPMVTVDGGVYHVDGRLVTMGLDPEQYREWALEPWDHVRALMAVARRAEVDSQLPSAGVV